MDAGGAGPVIVAFFGEGLIYDDGGWQIGNAFYSQYLRGT